MCYLQQLQQSPAHLQSVPQLQLQSLQVQPVTSTQQHFFSSVIIFPFIQGLIFNNERLQSVATTDSRSFLQD